ncbi:MAG: inorganic phosphate transporter [Prevotellaceae bacterium]|nr:inorganic phosphate transporter [Prevotellaceae bacterium]
MTTLYLCIVVFLLILAVFDLFVGVSNDAVNFLNSAIGAKAASFRTVMVIASMGIAIGAMMSAGMMDVARHGIMHPANYSFHEVMVVFLAVMVADVIILDIFNSLGLPTSTTVSMVFELLGGTFILALFKMSNDATLNLDMLLNSNKALSVILAIFVSVAIAFFFGVLVQYITRIIFTFNYKKHLRYTVALFGGISFTFLAYFIFFKGLAQSPYIGETTKQWVTTHTDSLMLATFVGSTLVAQLLHLLRVNVFKVVVLLGTFALAMAFAGNDLVNFIGVPMAGLSSFMDWQAHGAGNPDSFMMTSLMDSAQSPLLYLLLAGIIMIVAMSTSKKAQNVVKTSVDLSRQSEGDEIFGSSGVARRTVRITQEGGSLLTSIMPRFVLEWIDSRFNKEEAIISEGAAFDMIRAAINLVLSSALIIVGTNYKLPLSTTYVTFMVAMGTSLADRAWSRESAVFRVTGVINVIGGWFITAGVAFVTTAIVCAIFYFVGSVAMFAFMALVVVLLVRSNMKYHKKAKEEKKDDMFNLMMRSNDPEIVWDLLCKHVSRTQSFIIRFALEQFNSLLDGLNNESSKELKRIQNELKAENDQLKKFRRKEFLAMQRIPKDIAIERNTWFHLGANSNQQFIYCLKRMLEPAKEHVDNNFNPIPQAYIDDFEPTRRKINDLMMQAEQMISTCRFDQYDETLEIAENCKNELSLLRKRHIDRMQNYSGSKNYKIALVYLNILQESQEFLSIMRHQLRAGHKFLEKANTSI